MRPPIQNPPVVWVLVDDRPGNTTQSVGLAQALGWPYEVKELHFRPLARTIKYFFGPFAATCRGVDTERSAPLAPPWPDLVIAAGWRPAPVARWIGRQSGGRTRLVHLGRKGGHVAGLFDVVVTPVYCHLPSHPRRIEIAAPLTRIAPERLTQAAERWRSIVDHSPHPHMMLLVGGSTARHQLDAETARRLGEEVRAIIRAAGGSVFATTSRRTGQEATAALRVGLGTDAYVHQWQAGQQDNPYLAYLALADALIVTGESESMLAEAAAVGKPLYIYPLPAAHRPLRLKARWKLRIKDWVTTRAQASLRDAQGRTPWFQRSVARFCTLLIASGIIRPRRDLSALHRALIERGIARPFGEPLKVADHQPFREIDEVADKIRDMLGLEQRSD